MCCGVTSRSAAKSPTRIADVRFSIFSMIVMFSNPARSLYRKQ